MSLKRLRGTRTYLAGAMDKAPDGGVQWRQDITPWLRSLGVTVLDPCCKPIDICPETPEARAFLSRLKAEEKYDEYSADIRKLRCVDLRMVDLSDFIIVHVDNDIATCGTIEEITTANRSKKPIIVHCAQGKMACPGWIFGMIPHKMIFGSWLEVKEYLRYIHDQGTQQEDKRWYFFDFDIPSEALRGT